MINDWGLLLAFMIIAPEALNGNPVPAACLR